MQQMSQNKNFPRPGPPGPPGPMGNMNPPQLIPRGPPPPPYNHQPVFNLFDISFECKI